MNVSVNKKTECVDLGLIDYQAAWDYQTKLFQRNIDIKIENRSLAAEAQKPTTNYLIFCEHSHVFTLGKSGNESNLLISTENLAEIGATYVPINRGGDITYHGPGQLVVYPVFDLENFFTDIHQFMRTMEEAVILTLSAFGIKSGRLDKLTGVWLDETDPQHARKICALGVKISRWVTMHGLALNVNPDLNYFNYIVPCGIQDKAVTSMKKELGREVEIGRVKTALKKNFETTFGLEITD